jgi:hypothetical protein
MKATLRSAFAVLCAALCACASAPAPAPARAAVSDSTGGRHFLRGAQCLDPAMARSWIDLGRDTLLVDAGRYKYRIGISGACSAVTWSPVLLFRGDAVSGRVCGNIGDAILTRDYPCTITDMQLLDKQQYKALLEERDAGRKRKPTKAG